MIRAASQKWLCAEIVGVFCLWLGVVCAQEGEEGLLAGNYLENVIVGRDAALRLRAEVQFTDDDDELIENDPNYARFPSRIYSTEVKLFQADGFSASASYALWKSEQDQDSRRWGWDWRIPVLTTDYRDPTEAPPHVRMSYRNYEGEGDTPDTHYMYVGYDRSSAGGFYSLLQYRLTVEDDDYGGSQLSEYVSWRPTGRWRIGEQMAISRNEGSDEVGPWYGRVFATLFLHEDLTSLRLDARHNDAVDNPDFQEYNAYLYQKIGSRSFVRLNYRFYHDTAGLSSHACGIKLKHYFSARLSGHVGYRYYDHSEGADFDSFYAGVNLLF